MEKWVDNNIDIVLGTICQLQVLEDFTREHKEGFQRLLDNKNSKGQKNIDGIENAGRHITQKIL